MQMRAFRSVRAVVAAVLVSLAVGCGGKMGSPDPPATTPEAVYDIRGVVVAVDAGRRLLEIDHEAIPGFMPAMTMPYEVADATLLQGLAVGDRVSGTLRVDRRGYIITALAKV
jgi:Cu/Ag efflux protein CusF